MIREPHNFIKQRETALLYVERCIIKRKNNTIELCDKNGIVNVPIEQIAQLQMGAGTSITYAAVALLAKHKVSISWCKQKHKMFCYATENRKSNNLLKQCKLFSNDKTRLSVAVNMFKKRFGFAPDTSIDALRGLEGIRIKKAYRCLANKYDVPWKGRFYVPGHMEKSDLPNQMLTLVNQFMYGICNNAIVQIGLSPAIGFIHTGYMLSFVYDIADLYKTEISMDVAFQASAFSTTNHKGLLAKLFNEKMHKEKMNIRIVKDLKELLKL